MESRAKDKAELIKSNPPLPAKQASIFGFFGAAQKPSISVGSPSNTAGIESQSAAPVTAKKDKKASNPFSTGGGGYRFEQKVQAYFVALYLSEGIFPVCNRDDCYQIALQGRQSKFQTDDLVVYFKDSLQQESKLLMQIKHKMTFTKSDEPSQEALSQAWSDFKKGDPQVFDPATDKIVLVTGTLSQKVIDHVVGLFEWARTSPSETHFMARFDANANAKQDKLESIRSIIKAYIKTDVTDLELWQFLKCLDLMGFDFDVTNGKDVSRTLTLVKDRLETPTLENAQKVLNSICQEVGRHNQNAGVINRQTLEQGLVKQFIRRTTMATCWHVPPFNPKVFVGNQEPLEQIVERFQGRSSEAVIVPVLGLGGLGKTYLILKVLSLISNNYSLVAWFNSKDVKSLEEQFFDFAKEHHIYFEEGLPAASKIEKIKDWFVKHPEFLIIFDDAENYVNLRRFIPSQVGHVLITSINSVDWDNGIKVKPMSRSDGVKLLRNEAGQIVADLTDEQLAVLTDDLLGNLPLAIAQAGAYINMMQITVAEYIEHYLSFKKRMLEDKTLQDKRGEHHPVYITFELSIAQIGSGIAQDLLRFCAYLNPNNIPRALLHQALTPGESHLVVNEQILMLQRFSLVRVDPYFLGMHCVVQDVISEKMSSEGKHVLWVTKTIRLLNQCFTYSRYDRAVLEQAKLLVPHMLRAKDLKANLVEEIPASLRGEMLYKLGVFYLDYLFDAIGAQEFLKAAEPLLANTEFLARNNKYLLKTYSKNKNYEQASRYASLFPLHQENDIDVLCVLGNYHLRNEQNKECHEEAKRHFNKALILARDSNDSEKIAMINHYLGTSCRFHAEKQRNVASGAERKGWGSNWVEERKRESDTLFDEALRYYQEALKFKRDLHVEGHPEIARTLQQLGNVCLSKKDARSAFKYLTEALKIYEKYHGTEVHRDVAVVLYHLGLACSEIGQRDEASEHLNRSKQIFTQLPQGAPGFKTKNEYVAKIEAALKEVVSRSQSSVATYFSTMSSGASIPSTQNTLDSESKNSSSVLPTIGTKDDDAGSPPKRAKISTAEDHLANEEEQIELARSQEVLLDRQVTQVESVENKFGKREKVAGVPQLPQFMRHNKSRKVVQTQEEEELEIESNDALAASNNVSKKNGNC